MPMNTVKRGKQHAKASKKNRKWGRHKTRSPAAAQYRAEGRWITNKIRKLIQHVFKQPQDVGAKACLHLLIRGHALNAASANNRLTAHKYDLKLV
jgi:hypothetical protein